MSDDALRELANAAGIACDWTDIEGRQRSVGPDTLRAVLAALELPAASPAEIGDSRAQLEHNRHDAAGPLLTCEAGGMVAVSNASGRYRIIDESGAAHEGGIAEMEGGGGQVQAPAQPGYYQLELADRQHTLAVAPERCWRVSDASTGKRLWGLAVQLYALRRPGDGGIGDFAALRDFVKAAARHGAGAVAVSPVHAQYSADLNRFSPYAPSSRTMLNVLHAEAGFLADYAHPPPSPAEARRMERLEAAPLVNWPAAAREKLKRLRRLYDTFSAAPPGPAHAAFARFRAQGGRALEQHAIFEALHAAQFGADPWRWSWHSWPEELRDPASPAVMRFASEHAHQLGFHAFLQFLADHGLATAQGEAKAAGMPIGLISDLAVGVDAAGSQAWSRPGAMLRDLSLGAPADAFNAQGQNWGVSAFSPRGLRQDGYAPFLDVIRTALRHAGGVRIDHAMGLQRLWLVPQGAMAAEGAYLRYPLTDLLRLTALESWRHRAVIVGEDLGTVPDGFRDRMADAGMAGMRVLWFERNEQGWIPPERWSAEAVALTSTHDLPTVAGWWRGRDIAWRQRLGWIGDEAEARRQRRERTGERASLWHAMRQSGAANGRRPADGEAAANAAAAHIGRSPCALALLPVEDALALQEQPNIPGTLDEHPNWRRRLPGPSDKILDDPVVDARLARINRDRGI